MSRTLVLMPSRAKGGAENHASVLARALAARGDEVWYATSSSSANGTLRDSLEGAGIHVENRDFEWREEDRSNAGFARQFLRCVMLLKRFRPARCVVFLPWPTVALPAICALAWARVPMLLVFQLVPPEFLIGRKHLRLLRWVFGHSHVGAVAVCGENRQLLLNKLGLPGEKVAVVYNGTRTSEQCAPDELAAGSQLIAKLDMDSAAPLVCCAGRLCFQKGYDLVVPALPHLREEFPGLRCLWLGAGEPDYEAQLEARLSALGVRDMVVMPGAVDHAPGVLAQADVFLFPSRFEGHSLALTEAMAAGLSIVASDASGIPEVIRHGREGLIFRNGDSCDLMEKLRWALRNPEAMRRMGDAARERQREFTEEQMIAGTLRVMEKIERGEPLS